MISDLLSVIPIVLFLIAIGLAFALRVACRRRTGESLVAGDPYFFPIGECPSIEASVPNYRRHLDERDFRAWGLPPSPSRSSACALRRIDGGGRLSVSLSSETSAVVLPFVRRRA